MRKIAAVIFNTFPVWTWIAFDPWSLYSLGTYRARTSVGGHPIDVALGHGHFAAGGGEISLDIEVHHSSHPSWWHSRRLSRLVDVMLLLRGSARRLSHPTVVGCPAMTEIGRTGALAPPLPSECPAHPSLSRKSGSGHGACLDNCSWCCNRYPLDTPAIA